MFILFFVVIVSVFSVISVLVGFNTSRIRSNMSIMITV